MPSYPPAGTALADFQLIRHTVLCLILPICTASVSIYPVLRFDMMDSLLLVAFKGLFFTWTGNLLGNIWQLLLDGLLWMTLGGVTGLIVAVCVLRFLYQKRWLQRQNGLWNLAAKLSYPLVFFAIVAAMLACGATYGVQLGVQHRLDKALRPAVSASVPALRQYVDAKLAHAAGNAAVAQDLVQHMSHELTAYTGAGSTIGQWKQQGIDWVVAYVGQPVLTAAVGMILADRMEHLGIALGMSQDNAHVAAGAVRQLDFSRLDIGLTDAICSAIRIHVDLMFSHVYLAIGMVFFFLIGLVTCEVLLYYMVCLLTRRTVSDARDNGESR